jgi:hypothetical protein
MTNTQQPLLPGWRQVGPQVYANEHSSEPTVLICQFERSTFYSPKTQFEGLVELARTGRVAGATPEQAQTLESAMAKLDPGMLGRFKDAHESLVSQFTQIASIYVKEQRERDLPHLAIGVARQSQVDYAQAIQSGKPIRPKWGFDPDVPVHPAERPRQLYLACFETEADARLAMPPRLVGGYTRTQAGMVPFSAADREDAESVIASLAPYFERPGALGQLKDQSLTAKTTGMLWNLEQLVRGSR